MGISRQSPGGGGNTELLLKEFLRGASASGHETELIILNKFEISPCTSCGSCQENGQCIIDDDMQSMYNKLLEADYIVLASPIYFGGVSAQLKSFIDRCQTLWSRKYILKETLISPDKEKPFRIFHFHCRSTNARKFFEGAIIVIKTVFHVLDIKYKGELLFPCMERKETLLNS
jgi:multimeric flavodoxin WrbA